MRKAFVFILVLLAFLSNAEAVFACEPPPTNNPTYQNCESLGSGYKFGFKLTGARNGTYHLTSGDGRLTGGAPQDPQNNITISGSNGRTFDWQSSLGIDAVIVNANGKSTVKKLNEQQEGKDYHGTTDYRNRPSAVAEVYFCYDYELSVDTSAEGTITSAATWAITKTVDTAEQVKFAGETANFNYTVAVNRSAGSATGSVINTKVVVKNNTPLTAKIKYIKDYLTQLNKWVTLDCGKINLPYDLKPGKELTCTAEVDVTSKVETKNSVQVGTYGYVAGDKASADVQWSGETSAGQTTGGPVTITDTNAAFGGPYSISDNKSWTYPVSLTCPSDPAAYTNGVYTTTLDNTAKITETAQQASQSVKLTCYAPVSTITSTASYDAAYTWAITKTSPSQTLTLKINESAPVDYSVSVSVASRTESNFKYTGAIVLTNPHPTAPMTLTLTDETTPGAAAALTGCTNPVTIPAGQSVTCNYTASPTTRPAANNIKVVFNNIPFATIPAYDFSKAVVNEIDECVTVTDDALSTPLGTICSDKAPATYTYNHQIGPFSSCGERGYTNTATFVTNDTAASKYANWQLGITVKCPVITNCTYTAAYWAAHADPGSPATYNTTWDQLGAAGPNTPFFTTGQSWLQALNSDATGSVYNQLAHSYIVARLNVLHGAKASSTILTAIDHASGLLSQYATSQETIGEGAWDFTGTSDAISNFNDGWDGPSICPDCTY